MKGKILDFSIAESKGVISGDDGVRYTFPGKEWKSATPPQAGMRVDYETEGRSAVAVYSDQSMSDQAGSIKSNVDKTPYDGFYRSSDENMIAGVCAGLAHKWNVSRSGLRFATFLVTVFFWVPLLFYIICWIVFPSRPTKGRG